MFDFRHHSLRNTCNRRRGSVVVIVLIIILFASMLLVRMIELSSTDLLIAMRIADRDRLRADARSALETTLAVLEDFRTVDRALYSPSQGWADPLTYAAYVPREGVEIQVSFEDESGKLSLPRLNFDTLVQLLASLGLSPVDADRVADAMMVWMHKEHIAAESATSATVYLQDQLAHIPPQRSLRSFNELADIAVAKDFFYDADGRPTDLWHSFVQSVSLYDFESTNVNSAPASVFAANGWDDSQVNVLGSYLTNIQIATTTPPYIRSLDEARQQVGNLPMRNMGAQVRCLRINVIARQGASQFKLSALVSQPGAAKLPPPVTTALAQETPATGGQAAASPRASQQSQTSTNTAGNSLQYPFTILELTETSLPDAVSPPDAAAPSTAVASR